MASVSAFAFATHSDMDKRRLARRPAARRQGSSSSLTPRALKQLDVLDITMQPVKSSGFDVAAWREGVAAPAALIATPSIAPAGSESRRRRRTAEFSLILERTFSSAEPDLSLRIPESPTQFDTSSVSGCCISSLDDHSGQENVEPVHTGPPKQDVLPVRVATRPRSAFNDVSFLETNSTLVRVYSNTLATSKTPLARKTSLARKFSSKRPPLLEVAIPAQRTTHPLDRSIKPPSSPAPFTSTLLNSQNVHPQPLAIPSKAAKLLGITPTGLPRPAPRPSYHDEDDEDLAEDTKSQSSRSSLCSCLPPRPSLGSSRSTLGGGGGGPGSPTSTIHVRSQSPHPYSSPSSPFFTFRQQALRSKGDSSSSSPSSPYFASHDAAPARRSLPDVSSQTMLSSVSFETSLTHSILSESSKVTSKTKAVSPRFWSRTHNSDRAASQPSDLLLFVKGQQQQRVGSVIGEESERGGEEEEEEVEVLRKRKEKVARRMTRDDWADESERLRERIRQSLGY